MRYTLRQLEVFQAVARTESVSRAAQALAMSQSAASGALADLERQFDLQLFERAGKRLQLNELGRVLWPRAEALLDAARDLERTLAGHDEVGRLRIGATLTIGNYLGVHLVKRFLERHPESAVTLEVGNTAEIARKAATVEIDVGLVEGELQHPDLELTPWREDELVVFCAATHPLARKRSLRDRDLAATPWIVREPGSGTRQAFDRAMHGLLPNLDVVLELQHTEAIKQAVLGGLGLGCVSRLALEQEFAAGSLRPCVVVGRDFRRRFYFLLHRHKYRSPGIASWLALCGASG
jgi:DNA-binding transcriptional LysR family regulator